MPRLKGAFALACVFAGYPKLMVGARRGAPLAVGYGEGEMYLASDALAMAGLTDQIAYPEDGDWVELSPTGAIIHDEQGRRVNRPITTVQLSGALTGKGNFPHFMLKEIYDQPSVLGDSLRALVNPSTLDSEPARPADRFRPRPAPHHHRLRHRLLCRAGRRNTGSRSSRACRWTPTWPREFRYREPPMPEGGAALFISQSGETADTLAALQIRAWQGQTVISVVNVPRARSRAPPMRCCRRRPDPRSASPRPRPSPRSSTVLACLAVAAARARGAHRRQGRAPAGGRR